MPSRHLYLAGVLALLLPAASQAANDTAAPRAGYIRAAAADQDELEQARVNGVRLAYRLEGAGTPVIFVHGEGYSHELWNEQLEPFSRRYRVLTYDRRGHGQSEDPPTGYSETAHAEDLAALMRYFGMRDAHFVVNSRGGAIIIRFLKLFPERVRSITFADATIPLAPIGEDSAFHDVVPLLSAPPPTLQQALDGREGAKHSSFTRVAQSRPEVRAVLERMADQYSPRVAMNPQRSDMASATHIGPWNARDFPDMEKMYQPILLIVAEKSDVFFKDGAREADRLWPNTRFHQMPGVDHLLMLEDPEAFNRLVLDFLTDVDETIAGRNRWTEVRPGGDYQLQ